MDKIIVTRHKALVNFLVEIGLAGKDTPVIAHASPDEIKGKHVIGILPLDLAAFAERVTVVPMNLTPEMRGKELSLDQVRQVAGAPRTYKVEEV